MNAPSEIRQAAMTKSNPMQTFLWLLKREYWEHRGGFFWAPLIAGGVVIAIALLSLVVAEATAARHGINLGGMNLDTIAHNMTADQIAQFNAGLTVGLMALSIPIMITLSFVVFFYLLGALYDDRRDRSVLFWKSLPVSDLDTVLSKVVAAVLVAPALAIAATIVLHLAFLILVSAYAGLHSVNPLPLLWNPAPLLAMWTKLILLIPLNALWALPTVGWLLLCSAFARSKPFLWAVAVPVAFGAVMGFTHLLQQLSIPSAWYWKNIVGRILFGQDAFVYLSISLVAGIWWFLYRTRAGLVLRAVGDNHTSAHALGYPVLRIRMLAVLFGGACAGLGGAFLPLAYTPFFIPGMTAGRGWIALALVVFSSWLPGRLAIGAYLFGAVTILQLHAQGAGLGIPSQLMSSLPYLATIIVLVLMSGARSNAGSTAPASLGLVFVPDR